MHRGWLLFPAFIISAVSIIGLLNNNTGHTEQCQTVEQDDGHERRITVLVNNRAIRQGAPVHFDDASRKRLSVDQASSHQSPLNQSPLNQSPLTEQDFNTLPAEAIWADNVPSGTTLQRSHILLPGDTGYQAIADIRRHVSYSLTIERQRVNEQLIHPGVRVDITLIGSANKQPLGKSAYASSTPHLSATTVATDVLVTDVQIPDNSLDHSRIATVILSVAPENIKKLMLARHAGLLELTPSTLLPTASLQLKEAFPHHSEVTELRGETGHQGHQGQRGWP